MFRLIIALGVAFLLLPADLVTEKPESFSAAVASAEFDSMDTLNAILSTYDDVAGFCDRNVETCATGKAMINHAVIVANSSISQFSKTVENEAVSEASDPVTTGSISSSD